MKNKVYVYLFIALVILYIGLSIGLPTAAETLQRYHLTQARARLIYVTVAIPLTVVWLFALYSFQRFRSYADMVANENEGRGYNYLANGLTVLAFSLPLTSLVTTVLTYISSLAPRFEAANVIIRNYFALGLQFIAFTFLALGADALLRTLRTIKQPLPYPRLWGIIVVTFSSLFTWLVVARFGGSSASVYHLPNWLVILTLTIPYLISWYIGGLAAYRLNAYGMKVKGVVYKRMLKNLVLGMTFIIGLSILQRLLVTASERLSRLNVTPLLLIIYVVIALMTIGYGLVARGARQLKKIEEV